MGRFAITPAIDVGLHHPARVINVVTINTGAMIFVLTADLKAANRSAVTFASTGYSRRRGSLPCAVEIGFLCPQAHDDRRPAGMTLRYVGSNHVGHSAAATHNHESCAERRKL